MPDKITPPSNTDSSAAGLSVVLKKSAHQNVCPSLEQWISNFDSPLEWIPLTQQNGIVKAMPVLSNPTCYANLLQSICQQIPNGTSVEWQGNCYDVEGVEFEVNDLYHLRLLVTFETPIKTSIERATQALVFKWLNTANPELATQIHDQLISPFSIACEQLSTTKVRLHIATLKKSLLSPLLWGMGRDLGQAIEIIKKAGNLHPHVEIATTQSFQNLSQIQSDNSTVSLTFLSPTSFKQEQHIQPFPLPHSVFSGLLKRWNTFAPEELAFPRIEWQGWVAAYDLKTKVVRMEGGPQIGSVGWIRYRFPDVEQARIATILAHFASFSGVGRKTAMGMGQTRLRLPFNKAKPTRTNRSIHAKPFKSHSQGIRLDDLIDKAD